MNARLAAFVRHFESTSPVTLRLQRALVGIPSPTGSEAARASYVSAHFERPGFQRVRIDRVGNVIARRAGLEHASPVAVCAHLDTVFPLGTDVTVRQEGPRLYAPGITDNARGLAAMLAVVDGMDALQLRTRRPIEFVATVGEEGKGDLRGAKAYFAEAEPAVAAIAIDGAGDDHIVHRAVGARRFRITYRGRGGHSWSAYGMPNAVHAAARCAARLAERPLPKDPPTALTVALIEGGVSINAIPETALLEVDIRSTSADVLTTLESELRAIARRSANDENGERRHAEGALSTEIVRIGDRPCAEMPDDHPLVRSAAAISRQLGRDPRHVEASTDASVPMALGIPAIAVGGGGRGGQTHTPNEWYDDTEGARGIASALAVIVEAAS